MSGEKLWCLMQGLSTLDPIAYLRVDLQIETQIENHSHI